MYFGYSDNDGHNVDIKVYNAVADIFADSDVDYDEEPILAVIPDYGIGRVAFMTESWILIFDSAMLQGVMVHHGKADYDRGIALRQKRQIPSNFYSKHRNCLFKECKSTG